MRDLLKRYAKLALGKPFSPGLLNILVTSVCDMRCTHCFFTEQLDDAPRKKLQMSTREIETISETLGGNLGVLILAGGEPFTRKDLPEIARAFYTNNNLESVYITSNGQIQKRIFPDVTRMLAGMPAAERHRGSRHRRPEGAARQNPPETRIVGHRHRHGAPSCRP